MSLGVCLCVCRLSSVVCKRTCECTSKQAFSLFFIFLSFVALCVCDGSPAKTKGEEMSVLVR